jgi:predicted transposase/invertase (TIGR01784 family)
MTEMDEDKIVRITGVLHRKVYGGYNEFEEDTMSLSDDMRVIEKLHAEKAEIERSREEERRFREEAVSRMAELEQSREEAVFRVAELEQSREEDRQRTARNILRLGLPVEQAAQATGLPLETVQALAAQL